jgi:hypothetical protein
MLLDRSLTDRIYDGGPRLQAVVGFDVDLEPPQNATDAAAIVDVKVSVADCKGLTGCNKDGRLSLVAVTPEEGSHNAATLSQKASAFGGAIAAQIFSVGYSAQKRSQVFYLYRDMDTLSYQKPLMEANSVNFGWQFRPVLGRRTLTPGMRHMMAVLALPASDLPDQTQQPELKIEVSTRWVSYQAKTQTAPAKKGFFHPALPAEGGYLAASVVPVPTTASVQSSLASQVTSVKWVPSDTSTGVALVKGKNFFPGTKVNFGSKVFATEADGLVIKSDHELEVALPLSAAVMGGVLSGRYGAAVPIVGTGLPSTGLYISRLHFSPEGSDMYQLDIELTFYSNVTLAELTTKANPPIVMAKGTPVSYAPFWAERPLPPVAADVKDGVCYSPKCFTLTTFVPASAIQGGSSAIAVVFPFAGPTWSVSLPYYTPSVNVTRLGSATSTRLLISITDKSQTLCDDKWSVQLDKNTAFKQTGPELKCLDKGSQILSLDLPTKDLKLYQHFVLVHETFAPLVGDIPAAAPPPPGPSVDKPQTVNVGDLTMVIFTGANLDQVTKVQLVDDTMVKIVKQDAKSITIGLTKDLTLQARNIQMKLLSDGNDPVIATLTVAAPPKAGN